MSVTNTDDDVEQVLGPSDPHNIYEFEMVLEANTADQREQRDHRLLSTSENTNTTFEKTVLAKRNIWQAKEIISNPITKPGVTQLIADLIHTTPIDSDKDEGIGSGGLEVTIVFKVGKMGGYRPTDILLDGTSINEFNIPSGFWDLNSHLTKLIESQSNGLITTQIPYNGSQNY